MAGSGVAVVIELKEHTDATLALKPLTWKQWIVGVEERRAAIVACSNGHEATLLTHSIADDGMVTPSLICPYHCGFHEMVRLAGWRKEDQARV